MSDYISIWSHDNLDKSFNNLIQAVNIIKNKVDNEIDKLKSQLEIKPIQKFEPLFLEKLNIRFGSYYYSSAKCIRIYFEKECFDWLKENKKEFFVNLPLVCLNDRYLRFDLTKQDIEKALKVIDAVAECDKPTHEENIRRNQSNKETYTALFNLFERIGIKTKYYDYPTKRSKNPQWITYDWVHEISKQIPCNYDEKLLEKLVKQHKDKIQKWYDEEIRRIQEEQKKKEAEQRERERNKKLALLLAKYDLDLSCDWQDLLRTVISKNKYLWLAYHLEKNRLDWSSGCEDAEIGLFGFKVESELDQKIHDDIQHYVDNWSEYMDGRVFRDCKYNYNVLYDMVKEQNPDLYKDFEVILENMGDDWL